MLAADQPQDATAAATQQQTHPAWLQLLPPHVWQACVLPLLPHVSQAAFRQTSKVRSAASV